MLLETMSQPFKRARQTSATDNGFPSKVPTLVKPTGIGDSAAQASASAVRDFAQDNIAAPNAVLLIPYGTGSDTNTFSLRLIGWKEVVDPGNNAYNSNQLWVPFLLCELQATLSSGNPGVTNGLITTAMLFAKSLSITTGNSNVSCEVLSPAASAVLAHAVVDCKGCRLLEFTFTTGGSATDCNLLYATM